MPVATATVPTEKPGPYLKQLCKHFGHKVDVRFDDASGDIAFDWGACRLDASRPGALVLEATAADGERLERVQQVIGGHLERFGRRDELAVRWAPAQG